jgi:hypothetical protein
MFSGSHKLEFGVDRTITKATRKSKKDNMKSKFWSWGVDLKFMILFPTSTISMGVSQVRTSLDVCLARWHMLVTTLHTRNT